MKKSLVLSALLAGISVSAQASDFVPEQIILNDASAIELIADVLSGDEEARHHFDNLLKVADRARELLANRPDDLAAEVKSNLEKDIVDSLAFLLVDQDIARDLADSILQAAGSESRVLLDVINLAEDARAAHIARMVSELGQVEALLREMVLIRAGIVDGLPDWYKEQYKGETGQDLKR